VRPTGSLPMCAMARRAENLQEFRHGREVRMANACMPMIRFSIRCFEKCAELKLPVLIPHCGGLPRFFDPWDKDNERWEELKEFPQTRAAAVKVSAIETLMTERNHLFAKHPKVNFHRAHLAFHGNDCSARKMFALFRICTWTSPRCWGVGPATVTRRTISCENTRIACDGKDIYEVNEYKWYFRALETRDEYFEYYRRRHAFWRIYGFEVPTRS